MRKLMIVALCVLVTACSIKVEIVEHLDRTEKAIEIEVIKYPVENIEGVIPTNEDN